MCGVDNGKRKLSFSPDSFFNSFSNNPTISVNVLKDKSQVLFLPFPPRRSGNTRAVKGESL